MPIWWRRFVRIALVSDVFCRSYVKMDVMFVCLTCFFGMFIDDGNVRYGVPPPFLYGNTVVMTESKHCCVYGGAYIGI